MTDVKMKLHLCKEPDKFQFIELKPSREKRTHLTREGDRRKFCVIDAPRQYENLRLSQE